MSIKAGDIWVGPAGHTIEWMRDTKPGDPLTVSRMMVDGQAPNAWVAFPRWATRDGRTVDVLPPWPNVVLRDGKVLA